MSNSRISLTVAVVKCNTLNKQTQTNTFKHNLSVPWYLLNGTTDNSYLQEYSEMITELFVEVKFFK